MKLRVSALSELDESLHGDYEERDGAFYLRLDGDPSSTHALVPLADLNEANVKITEFRDNNRGLNATNEARQGNITTLTTERDRLQTRVTELEASAEEAPGADDINARIQKAAGQAQAPLLEKITALETANTEAEERAAEATKRVAKEGLINTLTAAGLKLDVEEFAMEDFLTRGAQVFVMENGQAVAKDGDTPLFSKVRPAEPLTVQEWGAGLSGAAPHLFKSSSGGGANGGSGSPAVRKVIADGDIGRNLEEVAAGGVDVALSQQG